MVEVDRVLWARREFGIRILNGLIVLMLEVITNFVMCSGRNYNTGGGFQYMKYVQMAQAG